VQRVDIINDKIESQTIYIERQKAVITRSEKAIDRTGKDFTQDIAVQENIINSAYLRLQVLDADVKAYTDQGKGFWKGDNIAKGVELRKQQKPERDQLNAEIKEAKAKIEKYRNEGRIAGDNNKTTIKEAEENIIVAQNKIDDLIIERQPLEKKLINLEAEVGPVKYIAALAVDWGFAEEVNLSKAVRWVILIIIVVFDPLAVLLLIAANQSLVRRFPVKPPKPQEIIDLEKPDDESIVLKWREMAEQASKKNAQEKQIKIKQQVDEWQQKLKKFNEKAPKPEDKPVEVIVEQPKKEPTKEQKIEAFDERLRAEEAELERVAAETKADIERIEETSKPVEDYNFEDEIKYDVDTEVKKTDEEPGIAKQIEKAMEGVQARIKPDLTEVIEPESQVKKPKVGALGTVLVDKGKVIKQQPAYTQNSEQNESGNWSKINEKRLIDEETYRQKIESRINDLIIKVKTGEMKLEDLAEEDQKLVKQAMDNGND
jgi:hypothetical protein